MDVRKLRKPNSPVVMSRWRNLKAVLMTYYRSLSNPFLTFLCALMSFQFWFQLLPLKTCNSIHILVGKCLQSSYQRTEVFPSKPNCSLKWRSLNGLSAWLVPHNQGGLEQKGMKYMGQMDGKVIIWMWMWMWMYELKVYTYISNEGTILTIILFKLES